MGARYAIRLDTEGWTVFDTLSDRAVVIGGRKQQALEFDDADKLAEKLNREARSSASAMDLRHR